MQNIAGVADALGPAHFADVNQTLDTLFQTDKRAIVHDIDDGAGNFVADGVACFDIFPRAFGLLLEPQRDLFVFPVHADDHALDFLIQFDQFGRVRNTAPAQIGNMEQAV